MEYVCPHTLSSNGEKIVFGVIVASKVHDCKKLLGVNCLTTHWVYNIIQNMFWVTVICPKIKTTSDCWWQWFATNTDIWIWAIFFVLMFWFHVLVPGLRLLNVDLILIVHRPTDLNPISWIWPVLLSAILLLLQLWPASLQPSRTSCFLMAVGCSTLLPGTLMRRPSTYGQKTF